MGFQERKYEGPRSFRVFSTGLLIVVGGRVLCAQDFLPEPLKIRGTTLSRPIELRILVDEVPSGQTLEIAGEALRDDRGVPIGNDPLRCTTLPRAPLPALLQSPAAWASQKTEWLCRQGSDYQRLVKGRLRFTPEAGFVRVQSRLFRKAIELVNLGGELKILNAVGIEDYLAGLVNKEIRSDYPREAVKAQVIAARSYALATAADRRRAGRYFDLYSTVQDQVYDGAAVEDARSVRLVRKTRGQVLLHQNDLLKAYYHAASGGFSELPQNVWGAHAEGRDELAYLARSSPADENIEGTRWSITLSPQIGLQWPGVGLITDIRILKRSQGRRVLQLEIVGSDGSRTLTGHDFRRQLGYSWIRSTYFYVRRTEQGWLIEGRGHGHGVGLSQLGARALARQGKSAEEILSHYYPYSNVQELDLDLSREKIQINSR